ncbi:unnamed protein product [Caenorhabditis angaria]|uniref:Uncharacterized protein n=1 Tax=Caenorhabditis angaria TaxID=860376 RepID=A0A9P1N9T0_9PELO|nr:unnamed protein product [Caenorhabditis angaria]
MVRRSSRLSKSTNSQNDAADQGSSSSQKPETSNEAEGNPTLENELGVDSNREQASSTRRLRQRRVVRNATNIDNAAQIPTSSSRKRSRSAQSNSEVAPKIGRKAAEENQQNGEEVQNLEDEGDPEDEFIEFEEDEEEGAEINAEFVRRFLTRAMDRNPRIFGDVLNPDHLVEYTMEYFTQNPNVFRRVCWNLEALKQWCNRQFVMGVANWIDFNRDPESSQIEDLNQGKYEVEIGEDGTFIATPLEPYPAIFPQHINQRLQEREDMRQDFAEARELIRARSFKEMMDHMVERNRRRREELERMMRGRV